MTEHMTESRVDRASLEQTIYVVMGTAGEYSDRNEWPVAAFMTEEDAQLRVRLAGDWLAQNYDPTDYSISRFQWLDENKNPYDPNMQVDYTGTTYFIYRVPLISYQINSRALAEQQSSHATDALADPSEAEGT